MYMIYVLILCDLHDFFVGELVTSHFCLVCFRNISAWPNEARAASEENTPEIARLNGTGLAQSKLGLRFLRTTRLNRVDYSTVIQIVDLRKYQHKWYLMGRVKLHAKLREGATKSQCNKTVWMGSQRVNCFNLFVGYNQHCTNLKGANCMRDYLSFSILW